MNDNRLRLQQHWWPGFLGIIGIIRFPHVLDAFYGTASSWAYLVPIRSRQSSPIK